MNPGERASGGVPSKTTVPLSHVRSTSGDPRLGDLLRSTLFALFSRVALASALAGGVVLAACEDAVRSSPLRASEPAAERDAPSGGSTSFNPSDAGQAEKEASRGNPLCGVGPNHCTPDDDGTEPSASGVACATPPNADVPEHEGCRIGKANDAFVPMCDEADPRGVDGVACASGSDCAPGFDCVEGDKGAVCRRYCCSDSCAARSSQNGGPTFCDIRELVDPALDRHLAPVCMPIKTCKLLRDGECGDDETCAIVTDTGDTGCVPKGSAEVGQLCDEEHCGSDLTCLGSPGDRRCYRLCRVDGADCGPSQTCTTGAIFQDTTFGVCKED